MTEFKMFDNVPLLKDKPPKAVNPTAKQKYPFPDLKVGGGFLIPASMNTSYNNISNLCRYYKKKHPGRVYECELFANGDIGVWRDEDVRPTQSPQDAPKPSTRYRKHLKALHALRHAARKPKP